MNTGIKINRLFKVETFIMLLFFSLLFFGKNFTKLEVYSGLYLYDLLLLIIAFIVFVKFRIKWSFPSIFLLIIIVLVYFVLSLVRHYKTQYMFLVIRQFALFIYLIVSYILANNFFSNRKMVVRATKFIILFSKISVISQLLFIFLSYFIDFKINHSNLGHQYLSPIVIMGIITFGAYAITFSKNTLTLLMFLLLLTFLAISINHATVFLSIFAMFLFKWLMKINTKQKIIGFIIILLFSSILFLFPEFTDKNVSWRLLYWQHVLHNVFIEHFAVFGNGFGEPYSTHEFAVNIKNTMHSNVLENNWKPLARWLIGPHNSLLTVMFHVGFIPLLLLFYPLKRFFSLLFFSEKFDKNLEFLLLSFLGLLIWISFNVILELPHSSLYFWLIFFTLAYYFKFDRMVKT